MASVLFNPFTKKLDFTGSNTNTLTISNFKGPQTVTPAPNGAITAFTTPDNYALGSVTVFVNGLAQSTSDVTETSNHTFTLSFAPLSTDVVQASYVLESGAGIYGTALYGTDTYA